ncbi:GGDEF domain-containing protein [Endothiovibrio diazotrophicus]
MISIPCLEALVQLTEVHDRREMTRRLVELLDQLFPARAIAVYEIYSRQRGREVARSAIEDLFYRNLLEPGEGAELPLTGEESFLRCFEREEMVVLDYAAEEGQRVVYPIHGVGGVMGLLVLDCFEDLGEELSYLDYLVRIYANHLLLLDKKERDALTGLYNRQSFDERISNVLRFNVSDGRRRTDAHYSHLAVLDIDFFKRINDRFGHLYGDEVLLLFGHIMEESFRVTDLLFRYGGEEFVVVLSEVDDADAERVLERFRAAVAAYPFPKVGQVTVSVGFTAIQPGEMPSAVVDKADKALYYAKYNGRDQVCFHDRLVVEGKIAAEELEEGEIELF